MFTSISARSASAYKQVSLETSVNTADSHQQVNLMFDGLLFSVGAARMALSHGDVPTKGMHINRAVRILSEGLLSTLDFEKGGELATNLKNVYDACLLRLTQANFYNDDAALAEVARMIKPVADAWKEIGGPGKAAMSQTH